MSDTNQTVDTSADAGEEAPFEAAFEAFLGHTFNDPGEVDLSGEDTNSGTSTESAPAGEDTVSGGNGADTIAAGSGNATEVAPNGTDSSQQASGDDIVDPALLAEMAGLAGPQGADTQAAPERQTETTAAPATGGEDFTPFTPTFDLPPAIIQGLFEAEDTETRQKSLVGVLSAFGNTITAVMDRRVDEKVKAFVENYTAEARTADAGRAITKHFYGKYPELVDYKPAVMKAWQVIASRNKGAEYTEDAAKQVANLAKASLKQAGVVFKEPTVAAPKTVTKTPPRKAPGNAFDAGGARPGGGLGQEPDAGPQELVDQMRDFGFS